MGDSPFRICDSERPYINAKDSLNTSFPNTSYIASFNREAMPEISRFYGIIIYMFFGDHNPPHIHIKYQEHKAVINIYDGTVTGSMPRRALKLVYEWMDLHYDDLMENWKLNEQRKLLKKIKPLS